MLQLQLDAHQQLDGEPMESDNFDSAEVGESTIHPAT